VCKNSFPKIINVDTYGTQIDFTIQEEKEEDKFSDLNKLNNKLEEEENELNDELEEEKNELINMQKILEQEKLRLKQLENNVFEQKRVVSALERKVKKYIN
jgi:predicted  nucleic acid-binding Zn-ribbon protein